MAHLLSHTARFGLIAAALLLLAAPARADSGAIRDPTGCTTGSAVANCRSLPSMAPRESGGSSGNRDKSQGGNSQGPSNGSRLLQSNPLPSQLIHRNLPPPQPAPGSRDLGGGARVIGH